ncbi:MAG: aspartyl protease [Prevotella sp.]|nr:aspartyl protease [Prevotella sp.]
MRSRPAIVTILLLLSTVAGAQEYYYNLKFRLSPKNFADTVDIEVDDGRIYLPVIIGGQPHRFLLDTGASMGAVFTDSPILAPPANSAPSSASAPSVGSAAAVPQPVGTITSHDATGQARSTEVLRLPDLQIGRLTITGYHANRLHRLSKDNSCEGIIGFDIFNKGLLAKIDTRNRRLILTDRRNHFRREPGFEARYRLRRHVPYVALTPFGIYADEARFDTGDRSFYALSRQSFDAAIAATPGEIEPQVEARTHGSQRISHFGTETNDEVAALCLRTLKWGDFSFRNVRTLTAQGPSAIGSALLDYGAVIINPRRRRLLFQPYERSFQCWVDNRLPDIYYIPDRQGRPIVGLVWEQSEPYRQGFRQGDVITAVDGTPIRSVADFTHYPFIANQTYTVTVSDKHGNIRLIRLAK